MSPEKLKRLRPVTCFTVIAATVMMAVNLAAFDLYWTEEDTIMASDIDGGNVTEIFNGENMHGFAVDVAVADDFIYWTDNAGVSDAGGVWRAERDGSNAELFIENDGNISNPQFLAIDDVNGKIYVSDWVNGIFVAELADGSGLANVANPAASNTGIALRGDDEILSLSAAGENTALYSTDVNTGSTSTVTTSLLGNHQQYGLVYAPDTDMAYVTNFADGTLVTYDFADDDVQYLRGGFSNLLGAKLSPSGTHILLVERGLGVSVYQISDGQVERIVPGDAHFGVAASVDPADIETFDDRILYRDDFSGGEPNGWFFEFEPASGTVEFVQDTDNAFGYGTSTYMMRAFEAQNINNTFFFPNTEDVVTLSLDFIRRPTDNDFRWVNFDIRVGQSRAHVLSLRVTNGNIRGTDPETPYGPEDTPIRIDAVVNNSNQAIEYTGPDGETTYSLPSGQASAWVDGEQAIESYNFARNAPIGGTMNSVRMLADSTTVATFDLTNLTVFRGAVVGAPIAAVAPAGFDDWRASHFTEDELADEGISGPGADPAGDGIANIIKYALGLDPKVSARDRLPYEEVREIDGEHYLTLVVTRATGIDDIELGVRASGDLQDYPDEAILVDDLTVDHGDGTVTETYRDVQPVGASDRRFMSLRVGFAD